MPYPIKLPDPELMIAERKDYGKLFARTADVPLYAQVRLISSKPLIGKRQSFYLGWIIKTARLANNKDRYALPKDIIEWIAEEVNKAYPNHAESTGLSDEEIAELEAEQKQKRKKYEKPH